MTCRFEQRAGALPAPHQGSWAQCAQTEKVVAPNKRDVSSNQIGPTVQPVFSEVRRLEPAWILAPSNRPTSPTRPRTHVHPRTRIHARRGFAGFGAADKTKKEVRQVRRLDKTSIHAGSRRPTSSPTLIAVRRTEREENDE